MDKECAFMHACIYVCMYVCMYVLGVFSTHQNNSQNQCVRNGRWHCGRVKDASVGLLSGDSGNHTGRRHTSLENEGDPVVLSRSSLVGVSAEYGGPGLTGWQILTCRMDTSLSPGDFDKQEGRPLRWGCGFLCCRWWSSKPGQLQKLGRWWLR